MNKAMNATGVENTTKVKAYVKPDIEVIEMEMEGFILTQSGDSDSNSGNTVGADYTGDEHGIWVREENEQ